MIDLKKVNEELAEYIRPQTFPLAIRMLKVGESLPEKFRMPLRDFKNRYATCQDIGLSRRYGWNLALTKEDMNCSPGILILGFDKVLRFYTEGNLCEGMYTETAEAGQRSEAAVDKFEMGKYHAILIAPLDRATFIPDLIVIYGNPAQVMRLVQGGLWKQGGKLTSSFSGRIDCADIIVTPIKTGECQVILPCSGDRIFGQTQDHEMAFSIPYARIEEVLEGLKGTHKGGIRYPVTSYLDYEAKFPPKYVDMMKMWQVREGKAKYTGMDHIRAAFKRTFTDRVPFYPIIGAYAGVQNGMTVREYLQDARKLAQAQIKTYEELKHDVVVVMADLVKEAEAAGSKLRFPENDICSVERPVLADDKGRLAKMEVPDPLKAGRLPMYLEACEQMASAIKESPVGGVVVGPWGIAVAMRGAERLILDTFDDPAFVHDLMRFTTEFAKRFGEAVKDTKVGLSFSEPASSCSLISPEIYREFIKPYHTELMNYFKERRVGTSLHICGYIDPIMEDIVETGVGAISMDALSSLNRMVQVSKKRVVVIGNVATTLFERGSKGEMEEAVKKCIEIGARGSAFILASGCEIPPNSRKENLQWFMEAALKYGTYENL